MSRSGYLQSFAVPEGWMDVDQLDNQDEGRASQRPTLKTIAFMTGLGVTTVSRALKDAPEIGPETRRRVQLVARQVGYRPNRAGVRLRTGKTNVISLVLDTQEPVGGFVSDIVYGVSEHIANTPYHLILTPYQRGVDPMAPVRYIVETGSADGIIISRTEPNDARVRYMTERGFPFATHGRTQVHSPHPFYDFDNAAFGLLAVRKLASLGRKRIALLPPPPALHYTQHTREGFLEAILEAGLAEVSLGSLTIDSGIDEIKRGVSQLMRRDQRPDGFVSSSASGAFAVVAGIEDSGLTLGRDIDLVSKQSFNILQMFRPQIHVVNEDFRRAGRELARAVLGAIDGKPLNALQGLDIPESVLSHR